MKTVTPILRADRLAGFFEPGIEDAYVAGGYVVAHGVLGPVPGRKAVRA